MGMERAAPMRMADWRYGLSSFHYIKQSRQPNNPFNPFSSDHTQGP
jgi:hypothetical protein